MSKEERIGRTHGSGGSGIAGLEKRETDGTRQEYVAFLKKNKIAYDERYIWE